MDSEKLHIYEILARQHEPMLLAYVLSLVLDPQLTEDIAQDTFLIAYRKIATLKNPDAFGAWLRGIARWEAFAALRKRGTEIPFEPAVLEGMEDVFGSLEQQRETERWQERFQAVEDCFRELPEKLQAVCQLHYLEDRKTQIGMGLGLYLSDFAKYPPSRTELKERKILPDGGVSEHWVSWRD